MTSDEENKKPQIIKAPIAIVSIDLIHEPVHPSMIITHYGPPPRSAGAAMQNILGSIRRQKKEDEQVIGAIRYRLHVIRTKHKAIYIGVNLIVCSCGRNFIL